MILSPAAGRLTVVSSERGGEGVRGGVPSAAGYLGEAQSSKRASTGSPTGTTSSTSSPVMSSSTTSSPSPTTKVAGA